MKKKTIISLVLGLAALMLILTGCGNSGSKESSAASKGSNSNEASGKITIVGSTAFSTSGCKAVDPTAVILPEVVLLSLFEVALVLLFPLPQPVRTSIKAAKPNTNEIIVFFFISKTPIQIRIDKIIYLTLIKIKVTCIYNVYLM